MSINGRLDVATLTPIGDGLFLETKAARAWFAAKAAITLELGVAPIISAPDGAYRDYAGQVRQKRILTAEGRPNDAASPGFSTHGLGISLDINNISKYNLPALERIMARFGFTRKIARESWHFTHDGVTAPASASVPVVVAAETELRRNEDMRLILHKPNAVDQAFYLVSDTNIVGPLQYSAPDIAAMEAAYGPHVITASMAGFEYAVAKNREATVGAILNALAAIQKGAL